MGRLFRRLAEPGHAVDQVAGLLIVAVAARRDQLVDPGGVHRQCLARVGAFAGLGERVLQPFRRAMAVRDGPCVGIRRFLYQHLDQQVGGRVPGASRAGAVQPCPQHRDGAVPGRLAAQPAQQAVRLEVRLPLEQAPGEGPGVVSAPCIGQEADSEYRQTFVEDGVLERPQPFLGPAQRFLPAPLGLAELGQFQVSERRGKVPGADGDARVDVVLPLGEEVEDFRQPVPIPVSAVIVAGGQWREGLPGRFGEAAVFRKPFLAQHLRI